MLRSFSISGFRNFGEQRQRVGPLHRVNILIGANNSGKSNVLRYIKRVVVPALRPRRGDSIRLLGIDRPITGNPVDSIEIGLAFDKAGKHSDWNSRWFHLLTDANVLDEQTGIIRFDVGLDQADQRNIYSGPMPDFTNSGEWNLLPGLEGHIAAVQHSDRSASFRNVMGRLFSQYQHDLQVHYIPSFRQISTRLDEFSEEYVKASGGDHLIDGLAELSAPRYNEQFKKLDFEKLRAFIGEIIGDPNVEIEIPADRSTINVKSGATFLPLESLGSGIHEVVMLAAEIILKKNSVILLEEPEVHLHPVLQKRLMHFIMRETDSQFFITTHSASIIDTDGAAVFGVSNLSGSGPAVRPLLTSQERFHACHELGFRSSDLLQSNCVIWVEGPSDRIYLKSWIGKFSRELEEGVHYSIMFYGGKLLSRVSVDDESLDDYIKLLPINRHPAILIDSDKSGPNSQIRAAKVRIVSEMGLIGGFSWVTSGREIENYYSYDDRHAAVISVHPNAGPRVGRRSRFDKPINFMSGAPPKERSADKIAIANYLTENCEVDPRMADFDSKMTELVNYILAANK